MLLDNIDLVVKQLLVLVALLTIQLLQLSKTLNLNVLTVIDELLIGFLAFCIGFGVVCHQFVGLSLDAIGCLLLLALGFCLALTCLGCSYLLCLDTSLALFSDT